MHDTTLEHLQRAAERRGLTVEYRGRHYLVGMKESPATLWRSRHPERIAEFIGRFRGRGT